MLEGLEPPKKVPACKVRALLEKLEPKDSEILKKALADEAWGSITLAEALNKRGIQISENPVRRHRQGKCSCNA
jgi:hypothetical protein